MIGNDIVDLRLARLQSNWKRERWFQKVFTASEIEKIQASEEQNLQVWKFWSMKEATYKAHQRRFRLVPKFNPKQFQCFSGKVIINHFAYQISTISEGNFTYSVAQDSSRAYISKLLINKNVKQELLECIASRIGSSLESIQLFKNSLGIPLITIDNEVKDISFSLTHHGNFSAFTIEL